MALERMIEQGRDCEDILCELAALRSAAQAVSSTLLEQYTVYALRHAPDAPALEQAVAHLIGVMEHFTR